MGYFENDGYDRLAGPVEFAVVHPNGEPDCVSAATPLSPHVHATPTEHTELSVVAFSSCFDYEDQISDTLWSHMRNDLGTELWLWLGDTVYSDSTDMDYKRRIYNEAKADPYYLANGPMAEPKIPVMATWDDHDFGANNQGNDYMCRVQSQNEFAYFYNLDPSDIRHPDQGGLTLTLTRTRTRSLILSALTLTYTLIHTSFA